MRRRRLVIELDQWGLAAVVLVLVMFWGLVLWLVIR
jgi:hypothetical protein